MCSAVFIIFMNAHFYMFVDIRYRSAHVLAYMSPVVPYCTLARPLVSLRVEGNMGHDSISYT